DDHVPAEDGPRTRCSAPGVTTEHPHHGIGDRRAQRAIAAVCANGLCHHNLLANSRSRSRAQGRAGRDHTDDSYSHLSAIVTSPRFDLEGLTPGRPAWPPSLAPHTGRDAPPRSGPPSAIVQARWLSARISSSPTR